MTDVTTMIHDLFVPGTSIIDKIVRPIIVYLFLLIGLRFAGKRCLASLNAFDLIVLLSISNTVQNAIIGNDNSVTGGILGASTLLIANYLMVRFFFKHQHLDELVEGKPSVLVKNGVVMKRHMDRELITLHELESAAHKQGFRSLSEIDSAEIEPSGALVFFAKTPRAEDIRDAELHKKLDDLMILVQRLSTKSP